MSMGIALICKLREDGLSLTYLGEKGINREMFRGDEIAVYDYAASHAQDHGVLPSPRTIEEECTITIQQYPDEPIGYWIDRIERRFQSQMIMDSLTKIQTAVGAGRIQDARSIVRNTYVDLEARMPTDALRRYGDVVGEVLENHDHLQRHGMLNGVPFGIPYLDFISNGAQPTDTVALVGRPGKGKSYLILKMADSAWEEGRIPMFVTMEMAAAQCVRRLIALKAHIPATLIRLGQVGFYARKHMVNKIEQIRVKSTDVPFYFLQGSLGSTVEDLVLRIRETRPDVVYVDGAYLLQTRSGTDSRWERVTACAEYLKMIASEFGIPVLATYQFNRRGPGSLGNIAFSDAVGQLASIVIGIDDEDEEVAADFEPTQYKLLELLKGREGERGTVRVTYDMNRMSITQDAVVKGYRTGDEYSNE